MLQLWGPFKLQSLNDSTPLELQMKQKSQTELRTKKLEKESLNIIVVPTF